MPETSESSLFDGFVLEMVPEYWRGIELLPVSMMEQVKEDVGVINGILHPEKKYDRLVGYVSRHVREKIGLNNLGISFDEFCKVVGEIEKGGVKVSGFVKNGFALRSMNYEYYGVMEEGVIKS